MGCWKHLSRAKNFSDLISDLSFEWAAKKRRLSLGRIGLNTKDEGRENWDELRPTVNN